MTRSARFVARVPGAIEPHFLRAQLVSGGYFSTVRVPAARGRILAPADVDAAAPVAVVSDGYWRRRLGADENAVGRTIVVNGVSVTVAGVTPPGFFGIWADADADIWLPLTLQPALHYENNSSGYADLDPDAPWAAQDAIAWLNVVARVDPKMVPQVTPALQTANQQGVAALAGLIEDPDSRTHMLAHTLTVEPFSRGFSGLRARFADALFALGGMVILVLLITAANIANLFLARAAGRTRDIGIRLSLGAGTGRLVQPVADGERHPRDHWRSRRSRFRLVDQQRPCTTGAGDIGSAAVLLCTATAHSSVRLRSLRPYRDRIWSRACVSRDCDGPEIRIRGQPARGRRTGSHAGHAVARRRSARAGGCRGLRRGAARQDAREFHARRPGLRRRRCGDSIL